MLRTTALILAVMLVAPYTVAAAAAQDDSAGASPFHLAPAVKSDLDTLTQAIDSETAAQPSEKSARESLHPLSLFKPKPLPPEPTASHAANSVVQIPVIHVSDLIAIASLPPIELDAQYSMPMTLREALEYAAYNSLPIRISHASYNYQKWQLAGSMISALPIPNFSTGYSYTRSKTLPNTIETARVFPVSIRYPVFQGGGVVFAMLAQYYREQGWRSAFHGSVNDALMDVYQKYNNLLLQHVLLRIRTQAVAVDQAQLHLNDALYQAGENPALPIMQSRTQLAADRQALADQQVAVRQAALALAFSLGMPMAINVVPAESTLREAHIADPDRLIDGWLDLALEHSPGLRQYEMFKLAARRNVTVAAASLYPSLSFGNTYSQSKTVVNPPGGTVGGVAVASLTAAQSGLGTASANALGQTASFSPTGSTTANTGVSNTVATQVVAASGGQPLNVIQSGSLVTSGAASPSFISSGGGGGSSNISGSNAPGVGVFGGTARSFSGQFGGSWSLSNFGLTTIASTFAARTLARQAGLQSDQELIVVANQVRGDYCNLTSARTRIDNAAYQVDSAAESLRLSNLRLSAGAGTNIDAVQAQRDYINALILQAQSIITSNIAQAQILHDTGVISVNTLTADNRIPAQ